VSCRMAVRGMARKVDAASYVATLFDHDPGGVYITYKLPTLADIYLGHGLELALYVTQHLDIARLDVGPDAPIRGNRETMLDHVDRSFDLSVDGQVLHAKELAFDNDISSKHG